MNAKDQIAVTQLRYWKYRLILSRIALARAEREVAGWQVLVDKAQREMELPPMFVSEAPGLPPVSFSPVGLE